MNERDFHKISEFFEHAFQFGVHADTGTSSSVWEVIADVEKIAYLRAQNCKGHSIFLRPLPVVSEFFMLADDLSCDMVERHLGQPGRMVVQSSPKNYQVWLRSANPMHDEVKKLLLHQLESDPGATPAMRWGRAPGYTNRKPRHQMANGLFPYARLHYIDCRPAHIDLPVLPIVGGRADISQRDTSCQSVGEISRKDYETGDESHTDFRFCMSLIRRGAMDSEIKQRLLAERTDWQHHQGGNRLDKYLERTIVRARLWTREK